MAHVHKGQSTDAENAKTSSSKAVEDDVRQISSKSAQAIAAESTSPAAPEGADENPSAARSGNPTRV
jgi:hypothetical protein